MKIFPHCTLNEGEELFGAPPVNLAVSEIFTVLSAVRSPVENARVLAEFVRRADELQSKAYSDLIGPAIEVGAEDFEKLRAFFHQAAYFGEMRMLSQILTYLHANAMVNLETEGKG
ncbi:hypothetical protein ACP4J4_20225 (plasmid) [Aureimonas ureilytica]|uniref:hypothetical protein n=1 Tax=Aureimonas ureilytica TaxID=401562 RepID=UPI003CEF384D